MSQSSEKRRVAVFFDGNNLDFLRRGLEIARLDFEKIITQVVEIIAEQLRDKPENFEICCARGRFTS